MTGFNAATAVDEMDWDFTHFGGGKGVVPEPSEKDITNYYKDLKKAVGKYTDLAQEAGSKDDLSQEDIKELMEAMDKIDVAKINGEVKKAVAKLCKDSPSTAELDHLPYRILNAFVQWLQEQISPEAKSVGTTKLQVVRTGA